jgi:adenylosuccinate synthase
LQVGSSVYKFHLLPSGLVYEHTTCVIGNGVVVHLPSFFNEIDDMQNPPDGGAPLKVEGDWP